MKSTILAVTGIDTDIGKTYATGFLARAFMASGLSTTTVKPVQTGCVGISEDIVTHRGLMGVDLSVADKEGVTCPYLFKKPCSPHLAASLENNSIEPQRILDSIEEVARDHEVVLVEGAGGLFVPLTRSYTFLDLLEEQGWPIVLVSSTRLGSINHTLAALDSLQRRQLDLCCLVYNRFVQSDPTIADDSLSIMREFLPRYGFNCPVLEIDGDGLIIESEEGLDVRSLLP